MKKALSTLLILLYCQISIAQVEKGFWTAGVSVGSFNYQSNNADHSFSANLSPSVGHFVAPNFLIGLGIPINLSSSKYSTSSNTTTAIGLSPFTRYYFGVSSLKPYIGLVLTYQYLHLRNESAPNIITTSKGDLMQIKPLIGLAYFINKNISVDGQLGYDWSTTKLKGSNGRGNEYSSNISDNSLTLTFGFNVFFGK